MCSFVDLEFYKIWIFSPHYRCLCAVSKVAGKGATVVEYLIQVFYKRLDAEEVDNQQVGLFTM